jgi:formiminoglutamase
MFYKKTEPQIWSGRKVDPQLGTQYWYQAVEVADLQLPNLTHADIGLLGYAVDEGVRRNQGRPGAAEGPDHIRQQLAKLAYHLREKKIADFGDIRIAQHTMEAAQESFAQGICQLLRQQIFPIGLGGGHDIAYANAKGVLQYLQEKAPQAVLGIINLDAHFDLRPVTHQPNSGTPFNQLLSQYPDQVGYFPIGIQRAANPPMLFELARQWQVPFIAAEACRDDHITGISSLVADFIDQYDYLYLSIDLDGFSSTFAPGVSAPSPMGFSPFFAEAIITAITASKKLISCDLAELNPIFDQDQQTARLVARLINKIADSL